MWRIGARHEKGARLAKTLLLPMTLQTKISPFFHLYRKKLFNLKTNYAPVNVEKKRMKCESKASPG
jgi:hypothetical protein